jgi:PAS domain S-box-containing protein
MRRIARVLFIGLISLGLMGAYPAPSQRVVRVGLYENPPKIYIDSAGNVAGFWPDLITAIAQKEGFEIRWVPGTWEENLARLENREIDLLPDVGWTAERLNLFAFSTETVLTSWARVYRPQGSKIETIFDLEGKTVAGLESSLNFDGPEGIKELTEKFNVHCAFLPLKSYDAVFQAIINGQADAAVTNKDFGDLNEAKYAVERTPIIIQPTSLRFAFPKTGELTPYLSVVVDRDLKTMLGDPTSVYYGAMEKYFGQDIKQTFFENIPTWFYELAGMALAIIILLLIATGIARAQIKRQTEKLQVNEERHRALLENIPDQIYRISGDGLILDYNTASTTDLFFSPVEFVGKYLTEILQSQQAGAILEKVKQAVATHTLQTHEFSTPWKDEIREFEARYAASGQDEVIAIVRDITLQKQAERELEASQKRYQTLADVAPVGIFHTDREGCTTYVNPSWCQIAGLPAAEALGNGWLKAVHPEDRENLAATWQKASQKQKISETDYRFLYPDGTVVWVLGQAVPELDAEDQLVGFVGTITDITQRKQVESLQSAVIRAESADRLKSAFLATMSHELRTPLNSIIGFTGILLQKLVGPLSAEQDKQISMIQSSAHHLLDLINDVLDISKIEAGQMDVVCENFAVSEAVRKSSEKIRPLAAKKGLALSSEVVPADIRLDSDRRRVEQILINLLGNAVKFTEKGQVRLECRVEGTELVTHVIDTGIGIEPEHIKDLFQPFQQVDSGLTRRYDGTGLGLSICKRLVDLLGGRIWVESIPGQGSTFAFTLPLIQNTEHTEYTEKELKNKLN